MKKYQHYALQGVDLGFILFMRGFDSRVCPPLLHDLRTADVVGFACYRGIGLYSFFNLGARWGVCG
jgi:hypothetical protein